MNPSLFNFNDAEVMTFFAVLIRFSTLFSILPFLGDRYVPMPVKVLFSLAVTVALYPALVSGGEVNPSEAYVWSSSTSMIITTITFEMLFALILGYVAKLTFDAINLGGNLVGNFMGFGMANTYDPNQDSQTQVISEFHIAIAMMIFLALDGHHLMLRAALHSYHFLGIGGMIGVFKAGLPGNFAQKLIEFTQYVVQFGVQMAAPVALSLFAVNVVFGVMAKAVPQLNVLVLSFSVTALIGLVIMFLNVGEFGEVTTQITSKLYAWMMEMARVIAG